MDDTFTCTGTGPVSTKSNVGTVNTKSKVQSKIALFSKKPKPSPLLSRPRPRETLVGKKKFWSNSVGDISTSKHDSQEELKGVRGCVSDNVEKFTLKQNSFTPVLSNQKWYNFESGTQISRYLSSPDSPNLKRLSSCEGSSFQNVIESTHVHGLSESSIPDSVSVQFRSDSHEYISSQNSHCSYLDRMEVCSNTPYDVTGNDIECGNFSRGTKNCSLTVGQCRSSKDVECSEQSNNSSVLPIVPFHGRISSPLLGLSQDQFCHNSWPRNRVDRNLRSNTQKTFSSPHLLRKQKSAHIVSTNLLSKMSEAESFGSTSSVFSNLPSVTNLTSCSERPHLSFVKGVSGVDFKQRTDVRCLYFLIWFTSSIIPQRMVSWFKEFNDQQRNLLLVKLLVFVMCGVYKYNVCTLLYMFHRVKVIVHRCIFYRFKWSLSCIVVVLIIVRTSYHGCLLI